MNEVRESKIVKRVVMPVEFIMRSIPDGAILAAQRKIMEMPLTAYDVEYIDNKVKSEHMSYEAALVEYLKGVSNGLIDTKYILAELTSKYPDRPHIRIDVKLTGDIVTK
jgi:hypothetical protein